MVYIIVNLTGEMGHDNVCRHNTPKVIKSTFMEFNRTNSNRFTLWLENYFSQHKE